MSDSITREQWSRDNYHCMACRVLGLESPYALHTHEMANGPARQKSLAEPSTWLRLCLTHHDEFHDLSIWPKARQLAVKLLCDPGLYDRERVNLLRGRQPEAITEAEIMEFVEQLKRERNK